MDPESIAWACAVIVTLDLMSARGHDKTGRSLLTAIRERATGGLQDALHELEAAPGEHDLQARFRIQLENSLKQDPSLSRDLIALMSGNAVDVVVPGVTAGDDVASARERRSHGRASLRGEWGIRPVNPWPDVVARP